LPCLRQVGHEALNHGTEAPCHLKVSRSVEPDLAEGQFNKVIPIWGRKNQSQPAIGITHTVVMQLTPAHHAEKPVQLIDGDYRRGWVMDRWGAP
jgi:hypothetical protein